MADLRNNIAKARDKFLQSKDGKKCLQGETGGQYLENRIVSAFLAGWHSKEEEGNSSTSNNTKRVVICSDNECDYCVKKANHMSCGVCKFSGRKLTPVS